MSDIQIIIKNIIATHKWLADNWDDGLPGWAPAEASNLIARNSLYRLLDLAHTLPSWLDNSMQSNGHLTLAWVSLGALLEGLMRFFLCVYEGGYCKKSFKRKNTILDPDKLNLEKLRQFYLSCNVWMETASEGCNEFVSLVQQRRNSIHAYQGREIGTFDEFWQCLRQYNDIIDDLVGRLPDTPPSECYY